MTRSSRCVHKPFTLAQHAFHVVPGKLHPRIKASKPGNGQMKLVLKNLILFKAAWTAVVFSAANGMAWLGALAVAGVVFEHLRTARNAALETRLLLIAGVVGLTWESLLVRAGLLEYSAGIIQAGLAPYWIVTMWLLFATTLNVGMKWLQRHWLVAAVAGGLGGPMAFFAGSKIGAVVFTDPVISLLVIGIGWAVLLPLLSALAGNLDAQADASVSESSYATNIEEYAK